MDNKPEIKIVRIQSGEDIIAEVHSETDSDLLVLNDPMHIIFKRLSTGQTVMMMMPWLPVELINENIATVYTDEILTLMNPKEELVSYYKKAAEQARLRMNEERSFNNFLEDDDELDGFDFAEGEEEDFVEEVTLEDMTSVMEAKKTGRLH
jgi:hypothetical protein